MRPSIVITSFPKSIYYREQIREQGVDMFVSGDPRIYITRSREQGVDMFVSGDLRIHITRSREQGVDMFVSSNIHKFVYLYRHMHRPTQKNIEPTHPKKTTVTAVAGSISR